MKAVSPGFGGDCPLVFVICIDASIAQQRPIATFDAGTVAENMALAAIDLGLGAGFVKSYPEVAIKKILRLTESVETEIMVCVGYPAETQPKPPKSAPIPIFRDRFGTKRNRKKEPMRTQTHAVPSPPSSEGDGLFAVALFMLTSARMTIDEPSRYGPKRLMDSLMRVLQLPQDTRDDFLSSVLTELQKRTDMQFSSMVYTKEYKEFLDSLIEKFVKELERRNNL
jgi:hypothetical protein